jgi:transcriptional regulator with XRE-family HTH domain
MELGAVGQRVAHNVREARGFMPYAELSRRLEVYGRGIPPLGLRRIEAGHRRVDVDDLVALADVLDVTPYTLLGKGKQ